MTIQIKHAFTSLKGDGGDATLVRPSNWNAAHTTSMATGQLIGRLTAGVGSFEEIPLSAYMASLLNTADAATLGSILGLFETGDVKFTMKNTASAGWLLLVGGTTLQVNTIGNAASGAVLRANADCLNLFTVIWTSFANTEAPTYDSTGTPVARGGSALADFNANKRIGVPNPVGKAIIGAGAANTVGVVTTLRVIGASGGVETVTLVIGEIPTHTHANSLSDPGHSHSAIQATSTRNDGTSVSSLFAFATSSPTSTNTTGITITNQAQGGGGAHQNMPPYLALNVMVKL